jgi:hypothetical protein
MTIEMMLTVDLLIYKIAERKRTSKQLPTDPLSRGHEHDDGDEEEERHLRRPEQPQTIEPSFASTNNWIRIHR